MALPARTLLYTQDMSHPLLNVGPFVFVAMFLLPFTPKGRKKAVLFVSSAATQILLRLTVKPIR